MTKEQAIAQAERFYSQYLSIAGKRPAKNPVVSAELDPFFSKSGREPQWKIVRQDHIEIYVHDKSGLVLTLSMPNAVRFFDSVTNKRPDKELEAQARKYQWLFSAAGYFVEPPRITYPQVNSTEAHRWFRWTRTHQNVPFERQGSSIGIDTETGELVGASLGLWGTLPTNKMGNVSSARAQEIALKLVREKYNGAPSAKQTDRKIVEMNRYWIDGDARALPETRFVWRVVIALRERNGIGFYVGVDSQTGEVVFGEEMAGRG